MKKLLILLLLFCYSEAAAETAVDKHLLNEMLTTVTNRYLEPVDNVTLVYNGLQALSDVDKNLVVSKGSDRFYIYYNQKINRSVRFPQDMQNIPQWVDTLAQIIDISTEISEKLSIRDFEIPDLIMKGMTSGLDKYTRYYSVYDYDDNEETNTVYTLFSERLIDDVLYLRVRVFNKQTAKAVENSLRQNQNINGVILDLRGNSGGMLNEALKVADLFCDNEIITYTAGRHNNNIHYYTSKEGALFGGALVIMVDGETASAAEVLAGGLQEQSRAKIIGMHTFGKGSIQTVTQMSNGGKLVLTGEQFFTPSGKVINEQGIEPDVCLSDTLTDSCPKEIRERRESDITQAVELVKKSF